MLRIAQVSDFYLPRLGGIEVHVCDLAGRQRASGHDVEVLTSTPGSDGSQTPRVVRLSGQLRRPHALHPFAVRAGLAALEAGGYDVVHAHVGVGSPVALLLARAAARGGTPTVVTVHSMWAGVGPVIGAVDLVGRWSRLPITWTAVSAAAAAPVRRVLAPGTAVDVIPNGVDQTQWRQPPAARVLDELILAAVMRLAPRKRSLPLLRIVRRAQRQLGSDVRLRLLVAGDGPQRAVMHSYLRRHHMQDAVTLLGRLERDTVRDLLGGAHLFLAPADLESFGIAALEARCAGLPVVAKSRGGVRDFVAHEREGLLADTDQDMVDAVVRLARDEPLRAQIAAHNATTDCPITWEAVLTRTEAAYQSAARAQGLPFASSRARGAVTPLRAGEPLREPMVTGSRT